MKGYKKLGRNSAHRKSMLRNLVTDLFREGRITTTDMRAKEAGRQAEKLITIAKKGDLHARRQVLEYLFDEDVVTKLFDEIAPSYEGRCGGYTRVILTGPRRGDAAEMAILELVLDEKEEKKPAKKATKKASAKKAEKVEEKKEEAEAPATEEAPAEEAKAE